MKRDLLVWRPSTGSWMRTGPAWTWRPPARWSWRAFAAFLKTLSNFLLRRRGDKKTFKSFVQISSEQVFSSPNLTTETFSTMVMAVALWRNPIRHTAISGQGSISHQDESSARLIQSVSCYIAAQLIECFDGDLRLETPLGELRFSTASPIDIALQSMQWGSYEKERERDNVCSSVERVRERPLRYFCVYVCLRLRERGRERQRVCLNNG